VNWIVEQTTATQQMGTHIGTIRFGLDPTTSALDVDRELHDLDNVYVADSSFFVSATAVNPALTIIANALRVADTITQRLGRTTCQARPATWDYP